MNVYVEKITKIYDANWSYIVRPNPETDGHAVDLGYKEGEEDKYICISPDALPEVIKALQRALEDLNLNRG